MLPNIVLVLSDDQPKGLMDAMPLTQSLIIDQGVTLGNYVTPTPLCSPSRASTLTGNHSHTTGVYTNYGGATGSWDAFADNESDTIATRLQAAGYYTGLTGKYINRFGDSGDTYVPPGWSYFAALENAADLTGENLYYGYKLRGTQPDEFHGNAPSDYSTDVIKNKAVAFINNAPSNQPLFLWFTPFGPHASFVPAPRHLGTWPAETKNIGGFNEADMSDKPEWMRDLPLVDSARELQQMTDMHETVMSIDDAVGALVTALTNKGRMADTLFIYMSDNGKMQGAHRFHKKDMPYKAASEVPCFMRWDGHIDPGSTSQRVTANIDITATMAEVAGITNWNIEGKSFLTQPRSGVILEQMKNPEQDHPAYVGYRTRKYLYIEWTRGLTDGKELYDYDVDPYELDNKAFDPAYSTIVDELAASTRAEAQPPPPGFQWRGTASTCSPFEVGEPPVTGSPMIFDSMPPTLDAWPGPFNTGVDPRIALTDSGSVTTTTNNQMIEFLNITGDVNVAHTGVKIRHCRIKGQVVNSNDTANYQIWNCTVGFLNGDSTGRGIGNKNFEARRNNVFGVLDGFKLEGNCTMRDNYIHDLFRTLDPSQGVGEFSHNDGAQSNQGSNIIIRHNTFYCWSFTDGEKAGDHLGDTPYSEASYQTSALMINNGVGNIDNVIIDNNLFRGTASKYVHTLQNTGGGFTITNVTVKNNFYGTEFRDYPDWHANSAGATTDNNQEITDDPKPLLTGKWADAPDDGHQGGGGSTGGKRFLGDPGNGNMYIGWNTVGSNFSAMHDLRGKLRGLSSPNYAASPNLTYGAYRGFYGYSGTQNFGSHSDATWGEVRSAAANCSVVSFTYDVGSASNALACIDGSRDSWIKNKLGPALIDFHDRYGTQMIIDMANEPEFQDGQWDNPLCLTRMRRAGRYLHFKLLESGVPESAFMIGTPTLVTEGSKLHATRHSVPIQLTATSWPGGVRGDATYYYIPDWKGTRTTSGGYWTDAYDPNPADFYQPGEMDEWGYGKGPVTRFINFNTYDKGWEQNPGFAQLSGFRAAVCSASNYNGNHFRWNRALWGGASPVLPVSTANDNGLPISIGEWGYGMWSTDAQGNPKWPATSTSSDVVETCRMWAETHVPDLVNNNVVAINKWRYYEPAYNGTNTNADSFTFHWIVGVGAPGGQQHGSHIYDDNNSNSKAYAAMFTRAEVKDPKPWPNGTAKPLSPQHASFDGH